MTDPASETSPPDRHALLADYTLIALALVSLVILAVQWRVPLRPGEQTALLWIDRAVIVAFGASFGARTFVDRDSPSRVAVRWPELLGLLPLTEPAFVAFRFYPLVQIIVVVARLSSGLDRHLGEKALSRFLDRYSHMVAEEIGDRVLIQAADTAEDIALKGRYAASVGESLQARREDVHGSLDKALDSNPHLRRVKHVPGVDRIVRGTVDAALDAAVAQLTSEEMDRIVEETIHRTLEDFRTEVARKEWKERGRVDVGDSV